MDPQRKTNIKRYFRLRPLIVAVVAAFSLIAGGLSFWSRINTPIDPSVIDARPSRKAPWSTEGVTLWKGTAGGLSVGDQVIAVEGRTMQYWANRLFDFHAKPPNIAIAVPLTYKVKHNGKLRDVRVRLQPYPLASVLVANWSLVLLTLLQLGLTIFVFIRRPENSAARAALLVGSLNAWAAPWWMGAKLGIIDLVMAKGLWNYIVGEISDAFALAAALHFLLVFPRPRRILIHHRWLIACVYTAPFILHGIWLAVVLPATSDTLERARLLASPVVLTKVGYPILIIMTLIFGYWSIKDTTSRQQLRLVSITIATGWALYIAFWLVPEVALGYPLLSEDLRFAVFLPVPITVTVAIMRYKLFDVEIIINWTAVIFLLTACLVITFEVLAGLLGMMIERKGGFAISLLIMAIMTPFVIEPLRKRIQHRMDQRLERDNRKPTE
jgi:two-component system NarL family sensor kinase